MPIKNYTSTVAVPKSIAKIEYRLAQAGALSIAKSYEDGRPIGMVFQINVNNVPMVFKLPAKSDRVYQYLRKQPKRIPTKTQLENIRMQADRTAWKILSDWIDIQVSLIELEQAEPVEIFFPYLYDAASDQTLYEKAKETGFKQLTSGTIKSYEE